MKKWRLNLNAFFEYADKKLKQNKMKKLSAEEKAFIKFYFDLPGIRKTVTSDDLFENITHRLTELIDATTIRFEKKAIQPAESLIKSQKVDEFVDFAKGLMENEEKEYKKSAGLRKTFPEVEEKLKDENYKLQVCLSSYVLIHLPTLFEKIHSLIPLPYRKLIKIPIDD